MAATTAYTAAGAQAASLPGLKTVVAALITAYKTNRVFADGVTTSGSAVVTSATAAFVASDAGRAVTGAGIPASTSIKSVDSATQVTLNKNATASASGVSVTIVAGDNTGVSNLTGKYLTPDQVASLMLRDKWSFAEAFAVASAFGKTIGYALS